MQHVVVTGANRGVGLAVARAAAERGDQVFACVRTPGAMPPLQSTVPITMDVSDEASIADAVGRISSHTSRIDLLVNSAGIYSTHCAHWDATRTGLDTISAKELMEVFRVNAAGAMLVLRALRPFLAQSSRGRVINLTSLLGSVSTRTTPGDYAYAASKAALNIMSRTAAAELRPEGTIVVAVTPGWVQTTMGGEAATLSPEESAIRLLRTADALHLDDSGRLLDEDGRDLPW